MTRETTTRLSARERRQQLLDAAKAIVVAGGFHAVSIEAVAREAGITRPVVYGHFHDLPGLLEALVEREAERALRQLAAVLPVDFAAGPLDRLLLAAYDGYLRAVESDPDTWRLVLMPPEGAPPSLREQIARGRDAVVAHLADAVRPGLAPGRQPPDAELTARALSALADEAARLLLTDPQRYPVERLLRHGEWLLASLAG
jgi:AcrR family transcriptional regulator